MDIQVDPKLFHEFHFKIAMPLRLPLTSRKIIEEFVDIDVNSEAVAKIVLRNQYVEYMLLQEIRGLGLKDNTPGLQAAIALLGMSRVRDFVCGLQILRTVSRVHPEIGEDGKLKFKASEHLTYALKVEEFVTTRKMQYADTAFAAGLMFDLMTAVGKEMFEAPKTFNEYVTEVFKHGMKAARIGVEIAKTFKNFPMMKYVYAGCLIHDVGKLAMELLYPPGAPNSFQAFRQDITKKPFTRDVIHHMETKRFGLTHEYYSSQLTYYYSIFRGIEKAILFHHEPYIIRNTNKEMYQFAALIALASNIATNFRAPKDTNDPIYKAWLTPELKDFKVDPKLLQMTMLKLGRDTF